MSKESSVSKTLMDFINFLKFLICLLGFATCLGSVVEQISEDNVSLLVRFRLDSEISNKNQDTLYTISTYEHWLISTGKSYQENTIHTLPGLSVKIETHRLDICISAEEETQTNKQNTFRTSCSCPRNLGWFNKYRMFYVASHSL